MLAAICPDNALTHHGFESPDVEHCSAFASAEQVISAVTEKIGTPILRLLLQNLLRDARHEDAHNFLQKVASGELFDAASSHCCPPACEAPDVPVQNMHKGWVRCGVWHQDFEQNYGDWCSCFHGTNPESLLNILLGGLQQPGRDGVRVRHGQTHSSSGCSIYASPSLEYAAFPCYANFVPIGKQHWVQFVLECRIRPGTFSVRPGTLSPNKHWPGDVTIDPAFAGRSGLEWLVEDPSDIVVSAVLLREFGPGADASLYGDLAPRVRKGPHGPEYTWTQLRVFFTRAGSALHDLEELLLLFGVADELLDQWKVTEEWLLEGSPGVVHPALGPELRACAVSVLTTMASTSGLCPEHAFQSLSLLDGLCARLGAEAVARQLPQTCAVLVRIILKEECVSARLPTFTREVDRMTQILRVNGLTVAEAQDLHALEAFILRALDWRVAPPSVSSWLTCYASRLCVLSKGAVLPWVEVALDWSKRRAGDFARRWAASPDAAPRRVAAGFLMLALVSVGLFPGAESFCDLVASKPLEGLDCTPAEASDRNLDLHDICKAMRISMDELMESSIVAMSVIAGPTP